MLLPLPTSLNRLYGIPLMVLAETGHTETFPPTSQEPLFQGEQAAAAYKMDHLPTSLSTWDRRGTFQAILAVSNAILVPYAPMTTRRKSLWTMP